MKRDQDRTPDAKRLYAASWADHLTDWVASLPGSTWIYYAGFGLILYAAQTAVFWLEGAHPPGTWLPSQGAHAFLALLSAALLGLFHLLDRKAENALSVLRPVLDVTPQEYEELRFRLTTVPALPTVLASLGGIAFVVLSTTLLGAPPGFLAVSHLPASASLVYAGYLICWWITGAFLYRTVHQLRTIQSIYNEHTQVSLFRMQPLYAFSGLTALTAAILSSASYLWLALNPGMLTDPTSLAFSLPITVISLAEFVWPLMGIHRLLDSEKARLLDSVTGRLESTARELHRRVDEDDLTNMDDLHKTMASLEIEYNAIERVPTWPWRPETMRLLITALALPLGVWIVQFLIQRLIGP